MTTETSPNMDVQAPQIDGEQDDAQNERDLHLQDIDRVFGSHSEQISDTVKEKLLTARATDPRIEKLLSWEDGKYFEENPDKLQAVLDRFNEMDEEEIVDEEPTSWLKRFSAKARYTAARPLIWLASRNANFREKYNNASPEEKAKMERRANVISFIGATAAAASIAILKYDAVGHLFNGSGAGHDMAGGNNNGEISVAPTGAEHSKPTHNEGAGSAYDHSLTPEQMFEVSHKNEMNFLDTNGRVRNDFNNIPVNSVNSPEHSHLFPGFDALENQYQKSPTELSAQLHQILSIEMAKGHSLDMIPKDLQDLAGRDQEAFVSRLSELLHKDDKLQGKLVDFTMDYLEKNGKAQDLTQNYGSWYIKIENGQPVAHFDTEVQSADPNDKVIMLSATKGIRLPCGQPIELHAEAQVSAPVYSEQPDYRPEGGGSHSIIRRTPSVPHTPNTPNTPNTPETPVTPETPEEPEQPEEPELPEPKNPAEDINVNPDLPEQVQMGDVRMGSGPKQTEQDVTPPPAKYEPPKPATDNTDTAPGARPNTGLHGGGQQQQAGTSTGAGSGNNSGETSGNVGE